MTSVGTSRRSLLAASAATAATGLAVTGCGSDDDGESSSKRKPGEKIQMTFWAWVPGIDKAVDLWNKQNPEIQVRLEKVSPHNSAQYAKMHSALKAGNPPDLAQVEYMNIPEFLLEKGLVELSEYGADKQKDKFVGWQWEQVVYDGGVYAVPQASGPMGLFYREDLYSKWNVEPPATWDDFEAAAKKIRKQGAYIDTFPASMGPWLAGLAWQAGAEWFRTEGDAWKVAIDSEPTRRVAEFWEGLVRQKLVKTLPVMQSPWYSALQSSDVVSWVSAQWGDALISGNAAKTKGKWRVAPMPQWKKGAGASANWGGSTTAVFSGAKHPQEAMDFAVWLNTDPKSIDLLIAGGYGWPAAKKGFEGSRLDRPSDFFGGQKYNDVFAASDKAVDTSWKWGPTTVAMINHMTDALTDAINSKGSFTDAMKTVQKQVIADMRDKGLKVEAA
ncbi:extracellular solute-binding protein [Streptomyces armeniacus]|uniref:Extracellular solute-binding protein n=2 Tax=Streptomyces armeniacus TaxID=83291 RepID=A0A345XPK9_9ACTN|nr:extracellular solute-binding protein [Streptomyces armeniacus]AXK33575.1 extracellular solute-binding protein [Streptomyces armeniacus]